LAECVGAVSQEVLARELIYSPAETGIEIAEEDMEKLAELRDALMDLEDTLRVYTSLDD
jgi:transcriptional/translational regulatory protein YebC/TACO1